ncbi:anti-sigma factor domain-containing protein [Sphaerisporangium album]|nr:hypothetical protein [Sphaerisporangium album]
MSAPVDVHTDGWGQRMSAAAKVGVTVEPAGGSARPTTTPVMLVDLPAA